MGATRRPLRQHYDQTVPIVVVDDALGAVLEPWRRHRMRFLDELASLTDEQWAATSRCTEWNTKDVISHLITVDSFWVLSLTMAGQGGPTTFIKDFDPIGTPDALVEPMRTQSPADILEQFRAGTTAMIATVDAVEDWTMLAESPMGHLSARMILAHALWDSWLHERDIFDPLGLPVPLETDELLTCLWYGMVFAGLQGGLIGDETPTGPGADAPIDVVLAFDDLPDALHVRIDQGVHLGFATDAPATNVGSALALTEQIAGRGLDGPAPALPPDLAAHLARAARTI